MGKVEIQSQIKWIVKFSDEIRELNRRREDIMRNLKRRFERFTAIALAVLMVVTTVDLSTFAVSAAGEGSGTYCEHHTEHTPECGYTEGIEGSLCTHEHGEECYSEVTTCVHNHDESCGYVEGVEDSCTHICSLENGCIISALNCTHEHDEACGYQAAVEGTPCNFECEECANASNDGSDTVSGNEVSDETTECTCGTDDPAFHATNCPAYIAPENPQCYCAEKCTEDTLNVWCDVCGVQGVSACQGEDTAVVYTDVVASITNDETVTNYATFDEALVNWTDGTTLTLLADVTGLTERIKTYAKGLSLDLNGHKIECSDNWTIWIDGDSGSELTIRDSNGGGYIQGSVYAVAGGSTLRLESGTVERVGANGNFTMTGGRIISEDGSGLNVNGEVDVVISGGEIYGSEYGVWISHGNVIISGDTKITGEGQYAITSFSSKVVISGTPTISGVAGEFYLMEKITLNTQPADGETWRVKIDTEEITDGIFAVPGEGIALDASKFASAMDGYDVKQNAKGELLLCNHQTAYAAVSNEDGSTHKMLCCCRETTVEESVACSGFGATCQTKAVCAACGQSYGETNPDVHTFNDDGKCVCGAERDAATTVDLSSLTATYVISDSGEYIFTGSGSYGIKVESGNPKIVLNNVNISLTDGDYYENNPINGIHIATTGGTTEILVLGESSITAKAGAGIFVAEGGTVKITGSSREDILIATGASGCSGIGGYVYYTNGSVNCGNIEISNVTVKAFGSVSSMGDRTPAIGGAGNGNCGYITIDNADVYAEGFISPPGYEGSSAIGTGVGWRNLEGGTIGEISIINDSKVYVTRGNYCDYIGCCGHENAPAEGVVDATAKSSTIYCYDTTDTTEPVQTLKYGALGGLLKEDGTCEGEHTGIICDNCGYCSCTHEGVEPTYAPTEDGSRHTATWSCCGYEVTEEHSWNCEPDEANTNKMTFSCGCTKGGTITVTGPEGAIYDGNNHTATVTVETKENEELIETPVITYDSLTEGVELVDGKPVNAGTYQANVSFEGVLSYQEFEIKKATPNIGTVSAESMKNTLDISNVVLSRTDGTISGTLSLKEGTELAYGTNDYTYVFKSGDANYNDVEGTVSITISDTNKPTATYKVGTDEWKQFINTITFGHFCKDYTTVDITYSDEGSGVADKQYYISNEEITNTENIQWSNYTVPLNINATGKYYIYVRVTDNYGNVVIQNSEGIVVYAESVIAPTSFSCEYGEENSLDVDITTNGNTFANLTDGSGNEIDTENYSYSIDGRTLTIKGEYLSNLDVGEYTYKICMNPQGVENTEVTLAYSFVVKVTAKKLTVTGATATSRAYIANDKTVDITGVTLSGKQGTDDVSVNLTGVKGTLSSDNAGIYTSLTLPALTLTGADKGNYELVQPTGPVTVWVSIEKLNAEIIVEYTSYGKIFGDSPFSLGVSDNNPEAEVTYKSDNEDVATVTSEGIVTIHKPGLAQITVSLAESTNYISAVNKQIAVVVAKKGGYTVDTIQRNYLYSRENADTIDLSAYLPADCGEVTYGTPDVREGRIFSVAPAMNGSVLGYSVAAGEVSAAAQITVTVKSENYADFTITVVPVLVDQMPVSPKTEVTLTNDTITYGDALSEMSFEEVVFEDEAGNAVEGTLAWKEATLKPEAGTTNATWVFTPDNEEYAVKEGSVAIVVKKATPVVVAPTVAERVYNPSAVLADSELSGGSATGVDGNDLNGSWSWKVSGTVPVVNNSGYEAVFIPVDINNYETVTETIRVKVNQATPVITQVNATTITYGDSLAASTVSGQAKHSDSVDMAVAGSFSWKDTTVKPAVADSDTTAFEVVFTPADSVNYKAVETTAKITVNKAEKAPNLPANVRNVPYSIKKVSEVLLPTDWTWQNGETALEVGVVCNAVAVYTGTDAGNYETESVTVAITRAACVHDGETELRDEAEESCTEDGYTGDTYCLICEEKLATGEAIPATGHKDADKNHVCDNGCNVAQGICEDADKDHDCDYGCDKVFGTCEDTDKDHDCDYGCSKVFGTCEDTDKDHDCDYGCDKAFGTCVDTDKDHDCDYGCSKVFGTCEDTDKDHDCDYGCDKAFGTCEDTDKDHDCDYGCDKVYGTCEDTDKDHDCDYGCDKVFGTCEDTDKDHDCDYGCDKVFGTCEDTDKDHDCDYGCDKVYGTCEDADKDHDCDYGCDKVFGTCVDTDKDHACDYGCDKVYGTCEDVDKDHACDYGCDKVFGTCEDTDKDHACDYGCSKVFGTCVDTDKDHACDYGCSKVYGTCEDADKDHACDYGCDKAFGTCVDTDKDHACDYGCDKVYGTCEDVDKDHDCDYGCDKVFGTHEAASGKHTCEYCGKAATSCKDDNHDHVCDICGEELEHSFLTEWKYDEDGHWHVCSCGLKKDEAEHSFTSQITKQPTVHAEGERTYTCSECEYSYSEPIEKVKETPSQPIQPTVDPGKPFIQDETGKIGWDVIRGETAKAKDGETIIVDMNGTTTVPGAVFDDIKGKDVTITLDMGTGVSWTINGKDITASKVNDINFEVKVGTKDNPINTIPVEVINKITGERYFVNISLTHDGELGLKAILNINLDKKNAGLFANLFYYNEKYERMQFIWADDIDEYGTAHLVFTHASEYSIVIDKNIMKDSTTVTSPRTADETRNMPTILFISAILSLSAASGCFYTAYRRKRRR